MNYVCFFLLFSTAFIHAKDNNDSCEFCRWLQDDYNRRSAATAIVHSYQTECKNQQVDHNCYHMSLTCAAKANVNSDLEEIRSEIERLREEAKQLKEEGLDTVGKGLLEAATAGTSFAAGQEIIGIGTGYYATKDIVNGCREYAAGAHKEEEANKLEEEFFSEKTEKYWWEFWKN